MSNINAFIDTYDVYFGVEIPIRHVLDNARIDESFLVIYDGDTGIPICSHTQQHEGAYREVFHTLPEKYDSSIHYYSEDRKNLYTNTKRYFARLRARNRETGKYEESNDIYFLCFDRPRIMFTQPSVEQYESHLSAYSVMAEIQIDYSYPQPFSNTNKIQKYKVSLSKTSTGKIISSDYIYGTGDLLGYEVNSDTITYTYRISYTFGDLEAGEYEAVISAITEQYMEVVEPSPRTLKVTLEEFPLSFYSVRNKEDMGSIELRCRPFNDDYDGITTINIQRKTIGDSKPWETIYSVPIETQEDLDFTFYDTTVCNRLKYKYRPSIVFDVDGVLAEATGVESNQVECCFDGLFIWDSELFIKLDTSIYTGMQVQQTVGIHQPLGSRTPVIVINSKSNYHTGGVGGRILNDSFGKKNADGTYGGFDEREAVKRRKKIDEFLTNKKAKILKDSIGNSFIVMVTEAPTYEFEEWNSALASLNFNYTEIGDLTSTKDIIRTKVLGGVI